MTADTESVVLITGAAHRVGAAMADYFHQRGWRVAIHYHQSEAAARSLVDNLNARRPGSATAFQAAMGDIPALDALPESLLDRWGRLDALVNNASSFYPTPLGKVDEAQWEDLLNSNLKGPFFLSQACLPALQKTRGCIINLVDIHAERPLANHSAYCIAKAGLAMMTRSLARDASPSVRVNGIAPGAVMWPTGEASLSEESKQKILKKIPLGQTGAAEDIARTAWFLATQAPYITGQIIAVDGGRSVVSD